MGHPTLAIRKPVLAEQVQVIILAGLSGCPPWVRASCSSSRSPTPDRGRGTGVAAQHPGIHEATISQPRYELPSLTAMSATCRTSNR
jgi:hypothetical protein